MVHQGQGLAFGFEAGHDLFGVHAELDNLEGDLAADRFLLLGHVNDAAAALADLLEELVAADGVARLLSDYDRRAKQASPQEIAGALLSAQQPTNLLLQFLIRAAGFGQALLARPALGEKTCPVKNFYKAVCVRHKLDSHGEGMI